eukprot:TRINITY_DN15574_c0_g1_i1.p1 TRINITY_DN15574_c0_g1~~TRINITY_DN15574_c0_g1_i1.p1  ORF type:complete len:262 (+),score=43.78 TRINITY_DN15574_c0_g1_i1:64-849(+)
MSRSANIKGFNVLITGASAGIGQACAEQFAALGARLILTARRVEKLEELKAKLESQFNAAVFVHQLDVRSWEQVTTFAEAIPKEFSAIDILVNNAGLALGVSHADKATVEEVDAMIDTNVKGVMHMLRAFLPGMKERNRGHIIQIGSVAGIESYPGGSVYTASKHALHALTKSLRMELVATPLRVTEIMPGLVNTEFSTVRFSGDQARAESVYAGLEPLVADDVADSVVFVATRPPHVQIAEILMFPTAQAAATTVHRVTK